MSGSSGTKPNPTGTLLASVLQHPATKSLFQETPYSNIYWLHNASTPNFKDAKRFAVVLEDPVAQPEVPLVQPGHEMAPHSIAMCLAGQWRADPQVTSTIR